MENHVWTQPIIRWAGSKRLLVPFVLPYLSSLGNSQYIEPFAGSACIFFAKRPKKAVINDLNEELINAYQIIRSNPRIVCRKAKKFEVLDDYYAVRSIDPNELSNIDRAARFLYLNRFCFNGIYRTNKKGLFNVPMGSRTGTVPDETRFYRTSIALRNTVLMHGDFMSVLPKVKSGDFVFMDPPYAVPSRKNRNEYGSGSFSENELPKLRNFFDESSHRGARVMLCYEDCDLIRDHFEGCLLRQITVQRNMQGFKCKSRLAQEVVITNFEI